MALTAHRDRLMLRVLALRSFMDLMQHASFSDAISHMSKAARRLLLTRPTYWHDSRTAGKTLIGELTKAYFPLNTSGLMSTTWSNVRGALTQFNLSFADQDLSAAHQADMFTRLHALCNPTSPQIPLDIRFAAWSLLRLLAYSAAQRLEEVAGVHTAPIMLMLEHVVHCITSHPEYSILALEEHMLPQVLFAT